MANNPSSSHRRPVYLIHAETKSGEAWISPHDEVADALAEFESTVAEWGYEEFETLNLRLVPALGPNPMEPDDSGAKAFSVANPAEEVGMTVAEVERILERLCRLGLVERID